MAMATQTLDNDFVGLEPGVLRFKTKNKSSSAQKVVRVAAGKDQEEDLNGPQRSVSMPFIQPGTSHANKAVSPLLMRNPIPLRSQANRAPDLPVGEAAAFRLKEKMKSASLNQKPIRIPGASKGRVMPAINPALLPRQPKMIPPLIQRNPIPLRNARVDAVVTRSAVTKSISLAVQKVKIMPDRSAKPSTKNWAPPRINPALLAPATKHVTLLIQRNPIPLRSQSVRPTPSAFIRLKEEEKEAAAQKVIKKAVRGTSRRNSGNEAGVGSTRKSRKGTDSANSRVAPKRNAGTAPPSKPQKLARGTPDYDSYEAVTESFMLNLGNDDPRIGGSLTGAAMAFENSEAGQFRAPKLPRPVRTPKTPRPKTAASRPRVMRASMMMPVHIPGPKTDNVFIGFYNSKENLYADERPPSMSLEEYEAQEGFAPSTSVEPKKKKLVKKGKGKKTDPTKPKAKTPTTASTRSKN